MRTRAIFDSEAVYTKRLSSLNALAAAVARAMAAAAACGIFPSVRVTLSSSLQAEALNSLQRGLRKKIRPLWNAFINKRPRDNASASPRSDAAASAPPAPGSNKRPASRSAAQSRAGPRAADGGLGPD